MNGIFNSRNYLPRKLPAQVTCPEASRNVNACCVKGIVASLAPPTCKAAKTRDRSPPMK
jgi:hypothetical protein